MTHSVPHMVDCSACGTSTEWDDYRGKYRKFRHNFFVCSYRTYKLIKRTGYFAYELKMVESVPESQKFYY